MRISGKELNATEGPLLGKIIRYVIPLMLTHMLQVFYSVADMMVVDLSNEADAVGAVGTTIPFVNLIINLCIGFATGTTVVLGHALGARDEEGSSRTVHTSVLLSLGLGIIGAVIGISLSRPILSVMGATGSVLDLATTYINIYLLGLPFIAVSTYIAAIFRTVGKANIPLYGALVCGAVNLGMNIFFIKVCSMSVDGVALATLIANVLSTVIYMFFILREKGSCRLSFKKLCFDRKIAKKIFKAGLPVGMQSTLMSLCNMYVQSSVLAINNLLTPEGATFQPVIKGDSAVANLEYLAYSGVSACFSASIVFTGQNYGAKKIERIPRVYGICTLLSVSITALLCGIMLLLNEPLLSLYGVYKGAEGTAEALAYNSAMTRFMLCTFSKIIVAVSEVGVGCSRGLGKATAPTVIDLACQGIFPVLWCLTIFPAFETLVALYLLYPVSRALSAISQTLLANISLKKCKASFT